VTRCTAAFRELGATMGTGTGKGIDDFPRAGALIEFWARARRLIFPLLPVVVAGCSIHPVQQEVTGVPPVEIINHIRCETRLAIQDKAIELLRNYNGGNDPRALFLAQRLEEARSKSWSFISRNDLPDADQRAFYNRYIQTGIAYDFTLDITEDNKAALLADPVRLITNGVAGIGVGASGEFSRENARRFIMSDTFAKLLADDHLPCSGDGVQNFAYPIAGRIGMRELISTFIDLNESQSLQSLDSGNSRVFADTMTFTTTLSGSVAPHVEIAPVGNKWGLASPTSFDAFGQRLDKHMVIVGLSMDVPKATAVALAPVAPLMAGRSALQKSRGVAPTEQSALDAVRQARIDAYLDRATH
jgi:hypothetical protein